MISSSDIVIEFLLNYAIITITAILFIASLISLIVIKRKRHPVIRGVSISVLVVTFLHIIFVVAAILLFNSSPPPI
jgi:uncharacterized RDD family membrane protein YckC